MKFEQKPDKIIISKPSNKAILGGLYVRYKPTKLWKEQNPTIKPEMTTDAIAGQTEYPLPIDFNYKIVEVKILKK